MINKLKEIWEKRGFEIILCICIGFIIIFGIYHWIIKKKGTFSKSNYYPYLPSKSYQYQKITKQQNRPKESKGEAECRRVLQSIFRKPFTSQRPDFLRNPVTGGNFNLELDCFNSELRLAVEYNGIQHYKFSNFFHRNKDQFENQKYRDEMKRRICKENGILLITVPYDVKLENIKSFIETELRKNGVKFRG